MVDCDLVRRFMMNHDIKSEGLLGGECGRPVGREVDTFYGILRW